MRPYVPSNRIAIRDSIDEDISDDVDDEVFIKDSKTSKVFEVFFKLFVANNKSFVFSFER